MQSYLPVCVCTEVQGAGLKMKASDQIPPGMALCYHLTPTPWFGSHLWHHEPTRPLHRGATGSIPPVWAAHHKTAAFQSFTFLCCVFQVARLQLQVFEILSRHRDAHNPQVKEALSRLNSELVDITTVSQLRSRSHRQAEGDVVVTEVTCAG